MIEPGQAAPDFTLPDQDGNAVALSQLRGRAVVLYFYPKADTPGCTTQACGVRDHAPDYEATGAVVLGVSRDPVPRLRAFAAKHGLAFPLLSDEDHAVGEEGGYRPHVTRQRADDLRYRRQARRAQGPPKAQAFRARRARAGRAGR